MYRRAYRRPGFGGGRLLIALVLAAIALGSYFFGTARVPNPVTGEVQRVSLSPEQEIAMGLQAAPEMARMHGGLLQDAETQALVDDVGSFIVRRSQAGDTEYQFEFHVLTDPETVNAFALPGGQVFLTAALYNRLQTEGQLAGVLAHEVGHVVGRHAAERIAKSQLIEGLTGAAVIASYDPSRPGSVSQAAMAAMVGQMVNMRYSREDELESDRLAVRFMANAGYDPRSLMQVMEILAEANPGGPPEFLSTHPDPGNRIGEIAAAIEAEFPDGLPAGLRQ
jgi:predicted Zn-dependent protease